MNIEEIRKNAPDGAIRYDDENWSCLTYFKKINSIWHWWSENYPKWDEYEMLFISEGDFFELTKPLYP